MIRNPFAEAFDGGASVIQSPSVSMSVPVGQPDINTPRVDESEANWLQDAALVAHNVMEQSAGKKVDYAKFLESAEKKLEKTISDVVFAVQKDVKVFDGAQVTYRDEDFVVKDAKLEQNEEYEWELTLVLRDKPGQTRTISGYTTKDTGEVLVNEDPVDVARLLTKVRDAVSKATDKIAAEATAALTQVLLKKTVSIDNPQMTAPLRVGVIDVVVAPGWEQDYTLTLGYINPKNTKPTSYELTTGYDTLETVEP